jgi:hypothetical protein
MADAETPAVETAEDNPTAEALLKLSDAELMEILGMNRQLKEAKENLAELSKLTGKAKEFADERIARMLTPDVRATEFSWILEDAKRRNKTAADEKADCGCCSVL